MEIESQ